MSLKKLLLALPLLLLAACSANNGHYGSANATADSTAAVAEGSPAAAGTAGILPGHKMIRTAQFQCRVQNVFAATTRLEQLVTSVGGIVQESHISNTTAETKTVAYKPDSLRQLQTYTTTSFITLRVPAPLLDSVVAVIPALCSFIDERTLRQTDVTYHYLANELKNAATDNKPAADRAMQLAKKSADPIAVQQFKNQVQDQQIDRQIDNQQLMDSVHYATITVAFSQPPQVLAQTVVNAEYATTAPYLTQCRSALMGGWQLLGSITIGLLDIWPLLVLLFGGWLFYRRFYRRSLFSMKK